MIWLSKIAAVAAILVLTSCMENDQYVLASFNVEGMDIRDGIL